jgi:hypothetical protein
LSSIILNLITLFTLSGLPSTVLMLRIILVTPRQRLVSLTVANQEQSPKPHHRHDHPLLRSPNISATMKTEYKNRTKPRMVKICQKTVMTNMLSKKATMSTAMTYLFGRTTLPLLHQSITTPYHSRIPQRLWRMPLPMWLWTSKPVLLIVVPNGQSSPECRLTKR